MAGAVFEGWRHRAAQFYFLILLFSFPLFSIPCQKGTCSSPVEIAAASLLSNGVNEGVAKALLYPASVFSRLELIVTNSEPFSFPNWKTLLKDMNMIVNSNANEKHSIPKVGIIVGSSLCIIGAGFALFGLMHVSTCGMLTLLWYIFTLGGKDSDVYALPLFGLALFCALSGVLNFRASVKREEVENQSQRVATAGKEKKQA